MTINTGVLKDRHNLLAFSAGIDSTALFFMLIDENIDFDIAIVDYNVREQSKQELAYAKDLSEKYNKQCHIKTVKLNGSNFEKNARDTRYTFFDELIQDKNYENLITAHQLNDKLEWFFMQFSKGAGLVEIIGLQEFEQRENYNLIRPILNYSKEELINFLDARNIKYFTDETNFEDKYKRNYFRKTFANKFLSEFESGVKKSFEYLEKDLKSLDIAQDPLVKEYDLEIFKNLNDKNKNIRIIDKSLKRRGLLLSKNQRDEILRQEEITISNQIAISITENLIWIAPKSTTVMDKKFKEFCRTNKIPKNIRAYLWEKNFKKSDIELMFQKLF